MKNVSVCFCTYEPYEHIPSHTYTVGATDINAVLQMMELLESGTLPHSECIDSLSASLSGYASLSRTKSPRSDTNIMPATLEISNLWYKNHPTLKCASCKGHPRYENALKKCAKNLAAGKCPDECMRRTVGALVFPQLYATQKQK